MSTLTSTSKILDNISGNKEHQSLAVEAVRMLTGGQGELNRLSQSFEQNGLGHIIDSWIGNGANAPISADQVQTVLGSGRLAELARKAGISPEAAGKYLSTTLPHVVDALTPDGRVAEAGDLMSRGRAIIAAFVSSKPRT